MIGLFRPVALAFVAILSLTAPLQAASCSAIGNAESGFASVNAFRAKAGLQPLARSAALEKAALTFACDMARRNYFGHHSPEGQGVNGRARSVGFNGRCVGENISRGQGVILSPTAAVQGWQSSSGHRAQLLAGRYDRAGIAGVMIGKNSYWVMILGGCTGSIFETFP
jgi:uncharacterized protein YkwD